jgi:hypothetical protein
VVSGTSFLTTVLIGRFTYPSQLGIYVLAMSLLISAMNFQHALIGLPYTIRRNRAQDHDPVNAGHSLALAAVLGLAAALVVAVVAVVMAAFATDPRLAVVTATLSAVLPLMVVRDFGRDFGIARLRFTEVLALDLTVSLIQVGALGMLAWLDQMSGVAALAATGTACAAAGIAGFCWTRGYFAFRIAGLFDTARESWDAGKWLLANLLALVIQVQITYWLVAAIAGTAATGVYCRMHERRRARQSDDYRTQQSDVCESRQRVRARRNRTTAKRGAQGRAAARHRNHRILHSDPALRRRHNATTVPQRRLRRERRRHRVARIVAAGGCDRSAGVERSVGHGPCPRELLPRIGGLTSFHRARTCPSGGLGSAWSRPWPPRRERGTQRFAVVVTMARQPRREHRTMMRSGPEFQPNPPTTTSRRSLSARILSRAPGETKHSFFAKPGASPFRARGPG